MKEVEQKFSILLNAIPEVIVIINQEGIIKLVNRQIKNVFGYAKEELIGKSVECLMPERFRGKHVDLRIGYAKAPTVREMGTNLELFGLRKDGREFPIDVSLSPMNYGEDGLIIAILRDITKRKKQEVELFKSEERFRSLMQESPLAIEILTPDGKLSQVNTAWMRLWGIGKEEAEQVMATYNMITDPQIEDLGIKKLVEKAFKGERVVLPPVEYSGERTAEDYKLEDITGNIVWIQCHLYSVKDKNGDIEYVVNTYMDISEIKKAELEAQKQREILARAERTTTMGELTGSIAHELNQPLTGILSNAQSAELMLKKGNIQLDELSEILTDIVNDTKRASQVIRNLRELFREQKSELLPIDVNTIVDATTKLLHSEVVTQQAILTNTCATSIPKVNGNWIQIQQVLVNLILNGLEAMYDTKQEDRQLLIATAYDKDEIKVWVEDCGIGIKDDSIDKIFELLATWKPGGMGIGLAISNSIIEAHGGRMWAENKPEGGARIGFSIPVLKEGNK